MWLDAEDRDAAPTGELAGGGMLLLLRLLVATIADRSLALSVARSLGRAETLPLRGGATV